MREVMRISTFPNYAEAMDYVDRNRAYIFTTPRTFYVSYERVEAL